MTDPVARAKRIFSPGKTLLLLVAVYFTVNVRWIWLYRQNNLLDIDEAGYLGMAFSYYRSLSGTGLGDWLKSVLSPGIQAPITPALASLLFWISTPSILVGFVVPLLAGVLCVISTYWLARCLMRAQSALLASALVASCPVLVIYTRSFHFAIPATALFTLALVCMLRSRNFSRPLWASLFGICMGLLPLTRTMTIAFLPGLVMGAVVHTLSQRRDLWPRLGVLTWSLMLASVVAGTWLLGSASQVFGYLFNFGYGRQSVEYGLKQSIFSSEALHNTLKMFLFNIYFPHALLSLVGMIAAGCLAVFNICRYGFTPTLTDFARSPALPLLLILTEAILALTSSGNSGSAFPAPILPLAIVLSVWAIDACLKNGFARSFAGFLGGFICFIAAVPLADLFWKSAQTWIVPLPFLGIEPIIKSGNGTLQHYELNNTNIAKPLKSEQDDKQLTGTQRQAWMTLIEQSSQALRANPAAAKGGVVFGFRHYYLNPNTIRLDSLMNGINLYGLNSISPSETEESVKGYVDWLSKKDTARACLLLTFTGVQGMFIPVVSYGQMVQAAKIVGFVPSQSWSAPTGQQLQLWKRDLPENACK